MSLDTAFAASPPPLYARREPGALVFSDGSRLSFGESAPGRILLTAPQDMAHALSAFEALTSEGPECVILLRPPGWEGLLPELLRRGIAVAFENGFAVFPALFWQDPARWLCGPAPAYPELFVAGPHGRHPLRPPKARGEVYRRYIPWLGQEFSLRALTMADLPTFHRWQNDPRVAAFFEESGTVEHHRACLEKIAADPHILPLIGSLDERDFGYFEIYWARENRLGAVHDCGAWDRGWHVLIGEEDIRGADYLTAWLPSLMHYMFLAEPRTRAILGEPRASHHQQLRNLGRSGFARLRDFDFAHKRAALVQLERQHFFENRLWARPAESDGRPLGLSPSTLL